MNLSPRARALLPIYLCAWLLVAAAGIYLAAHTGHPWWYGAVGTYLLFYFTNGTAAYVFRSRQARQEGLEPPGYFSYLLFGSAGFRKSMQREVAVPRSIREILGLAFMLCGGLFVLIALFVPFGLKWHTASDVAWALAITAMPLALGVTIGYVGIRLGEVGDHEPLIPRRRTGRSES